MAVQLKLCLYIFTPRKIGGRSWFPNLTTWGPWVGDDEKPLVSAFEMKNPSLRVGNIIIHRKHARMCGFHYGTPMETPMEILWTKWKWWNYWIKLFSEIMATQWTLFLGFWKALLFWVFVWPPNLEGCMNPYNSCSTGCPFLLSFIWMGVSKNRGTPKHPKMIIFSRKPHGCWVPSF